MSHGPNGTRDHRLRDAGIKRRWEDREAREMLEKNRREELAKAEFRPTIFKDCRFDTGRARS